jgi:hypothetical protein
MSGITIFAVLDEFGDFIGEFRLPFLLTEEQKEQLVHGSEYRDYETYFGEDRDGTLDDPEAVSRAQDIIAQFHVLDVKQGLFDKD